MRWVFIRPFYQPPYYDPEVQEPLGLEYLAASRRQLGDRVLILDSILSDCDEQRLARRAVSFNPDAIGFSLTTAYEIDSVNAVYHELIRLFPERKLHWLAGGNFVTCETERAAAALPSDFQLVRGEGENALTALVENWSGHSSGGISTAISVRPRPSPTLIVFLSPARPFAREILARGSAFNIQGSRGCCGCCHYCSSPGMNPGGGKRWRGRSIAHVVAEISDLHHRFGATAFNFIDEDFLGANHQSRQRARQLAQALQQEKLSISFGMQVRPDALDEEIIDCLTRAGLVYLFMGIESDDPKDFARWNRPWPGDPWRLIPYIRERGAEVNVGTLLFHPEATFAGIRRFAGRLHAYRLFDYRTAINRLDAMPGSHFYRQALQTGTITAAIAGPQPLPYHDPRIGDFHKDLAAALAPIGPASMQAVCSLPSLLVQGDPDREQQLERLRQIITSLDQAVAATFFALLDYHQQQHPPDAAVAPWQRKNLTIALTAAQNLATANLADHEELRDAITLESENFS